MDRDTIARRQRRKQIQLVLDDERAREAVLAERLDEIVTEAEGPRLDARILERLDAEDAALVREVLDPALPHDEDEDEAEGFVLAVESDASEEDDVDDEIARLHGEIADSQRRQQAYRRYLDALDD